MSTDPENTCFSWAPLLRAVWAGTTEGDVSVWQNVWHWVWSPQVPAPRRRFPPTHISLGSVRITLVLVWEPSPCRSARVASAKEGRRPGSGEGGLPWLSGSRRGAAKGPGARAVWPAFGRGPGGPGLSFWRSRRLLLLLLLLAPAAPLGGGDSSLRRPETRRRWKLRGAHGWERAGAREPWRWRRR